MSSYIPHPLFTPADYVHHHTEKSMQQASASDSNENFCEELITYFPFSVIEYRIEEGRRRQ
jgi:hypothetical protein